MPQEEPQEGASGGEGADMGVYCAFGDHYVPACRKEPGCFDCIDCTKEQDEHFESVEPTPEATPRSMPVGPSCST